LDLFRQHVQGKLRLGVAPLLDDGSVRFVAADLDARDYATFRSYVPTILDRAKQLDRLVTIPVKTRSGGIHLYGFFARPIAAESALQWLEELRKELDLDETVCLPAEFRPKSFVPATEDQVARREDDCPGGWLHLPYCGNDPLTRGAALHWDGSEMTQDEFAAVIKDREYRDELRLRAAAALKGKPKKDYEKPLE
jgi:hypothetical protein